MNAPVLALDLGSTGVRALVVRSDGSVAGRAARPVATRLPAPGCVEHDPEALWQESVAVLREALRRAGLGARDLAGLGVVTQRSTALAWDARSLAPLGPALSWQDRRTRPAVDALRARGIPLNTMASATKFAWLLKHVPAVAEAARAGRLRLGTPDAWLTARLSGGALFVTDPGQASCTGLAGPADTRFAEAALALFGLEPDWLPALAPTSAALGETPAALLGAPVALAARAGDQQAACFAQGVRAPGRGKLTLGTSAMLDVHTGDAPARPPRGAFALVLWELADGERAFCVEGSAVSAGSAVEWLVRLGILAEPAALDAAAADDAVGLVFVPALEGLGSPYNEPRARALLGGLTRGATRAHVARAVVDGVAHRAADLVEALPLAAGPLPVDGGLCGSRALLQAVADLSGRLVAPPREHETTALGAAFLAGRACGWAGDPAEGGAPPSGPLLRPRIDEAERRARRADWRRAVERCLADAADAGGSARRPG